MPIADVSLILTGIAVGLASIVMVFVVCGLALAGLARVLPQRDEPRVIVGPGEPSQATNDPTPAGHDRTPSE